MFFSFQWKVPSSDYNGTCRRKIAEHKIEQKNYSEKLKMKNEQN